MDQQASVVPCCLLSPRESATKLKTDTHHVWEEIKAIGRKKYVLSLRYNQEKLLKASCREIEHNGGRGKRPSKPLQTGSGPFTSAPAAGAASSSLQVVNARLSSCPDLDWSLAALENDEVDGVGGGSRVSNYQDENWELHAEGAEGSSRGWRADAKTLTSSH